MSQQDELSYGGEDSGEGEGSDEDDSKSCGSRKEILDFEQAQMGGLVMSPEELLRRANDMTTMNS